MAEAIKDGLQPDDIEALEGMGFGPGTGPNSATWAVAIELIYAVQDAMDGAPA